MPADQTKTGMGPRRQGDTEPSRTDDSKRSLDRAIDRSRAADDDYERGKQPGADGVEGPHETMKPGTRRSIDESGV